MNRKSALEDFEEWFLADVNEDFLTVSKMT
jgi:hypothetical protein